MRFDIPGQGKIISFYGEDNQALAHMEQLEELIQAISRMHRTKHSGSGDSGAYEDLVASFAEVLICLEQIQEIYDIPNNVIQSMLYRKMSEQEGWIERYA